MTTYIYMVRHGESPKTEENERTRGLTEQGRSDACKVKDLLMSEGVDTFISSPYNRAVLTIERLAQNLEKEISIYEDLKECIFSSENKVISNKELYPIVKKMFDDTNYSLPGGETYAESQKRAVAVLREILSTYKGHKIVIGTHGLVMTSMMAYFDDQYDYEFLMQTSKPDVYRMEFHDEELIGVQRLWQN